MVDFIGVGAQKSGTSWAYACLYEHPEICAPVKEIHFFSRPRFVKGKEWYESHFKSCDTAKQKGEFSTSYLYSKETPERIKELYPDVKLIAILRNPVARAVSQYFNAIKAGEISETISFEAYQAEESSVLEQGLYNLQLERYRALFNKDQLLVLIYEDIKKDPKAFMRSIYQFLNIAEDFESTMLYKEINVARAPRAMSLERFMHHSSEVLRKIGLDRFVHGIRKTGLPDLVRKYNTKKKAEVAIDTHSLKGYFTKDVERLSVVLQRDLLTEWNIYESKT